ncbi:MAG TPA: NUDIX hydrolase [Alphaproteobacteria bacterium]|nr:NUDIX hydrolase [Alphaproteobacteria bacterium]
MNRSYPERPFVGVGALVFRGEKVLLVRRGKPPRKGQWSIPGGMQQTGETVAEAARREVREETGLDVEIGETVAVIDSIARDEAGAVEYHYTLVDVIAEWRAGEAVAGDDAAEVAWTAPDRLQSFELWHETVRVIQLAAARRKGRRTNAKAAGPLDIARVSGEIG